MIAILPPGSQRNFNFKVFRLLWSLDSTPPDKIQLAPRLVEHNSGGIGDIETTAMGVHGNAHHLFRGQAVEYMEW